MSDTTELKKDIRELVKKLSFQFDTILYEENILGKKDSRKYHGVSKDKGICLFVCNNKLSDDRIKAGQRASIFEKCYWLSLSSCKDKMLVFTNNDFHKKFILEYSDYLHDIKPICVET